MTPARTHREVTEIVHLNKIIHVASLLKRLAISHKFETEVTQQMAVALQLRQKMLKKLSLVSFEEKKGLFTQKNNKICLNSPNYLAALHKAACLDCIGTIKEMNLMLNHESVGSSIRFNIWTSAVDMVTRGERFGIILKKQLTCKHSRYIEPRPC
ncbi:hypothetical protein M885DRAFT_573194 [Pelagophyceae sp. CCMP2097]|nr:hypothetical protein M885DRAFT_573194 [Pelagophyceae sp. CCMP2097]